MRQEWPGVSVVMPVLNEERHLEAAVAGVLGQDYPGELEVVLAVGPSRDRTREIADAITERDPRVRVVDHPAAHAAQSRRMSGCAKDTVSSKTVSGRSKSAFSQLCNKRTSSSPANGSAPCFGKSRSGT